MDNGALHSHSCKVQRRGGSKCKYHMAVCVITVGQLLVGSFTKIQLSYEKPAEDIWNIVNL